MNSSYGSFDHLDDWSWYAPGWNSTPSTNAEYGLDNDAFSTSSGDFAPMPSSWQTTSSWSSGPSGPCLTIPQHSQYNFDQGQQVWFVSDAHINNSGQPPSFGSERSRPTAEMMGIPPLPASTAASPPLDGSGITTDDQCTYPRNTTYDQLAVAPEFLQALFPSPSLPRRDPPSLYDDDGQPLQKQSPRFEHDIYTALWVRGEGVSRAGWCGFCSSWLKLKDSAYW